MKGKIVQLDLDENFGHIRPEDGDERIKFFYNLPEEQVQTLKDSIVNGTSVSMIFTEHNFVFNVSPEEES